MNPILDQLESKQRHDLLGALRVVRFAVEALREGERFDGADGAEQIAAVEKAVSAIEEILGVRAAGN